MQAVLELPPASQGVIDGKQAVLIWPADQSGSLLDPAGCAVHMIPGDAQDEHLTYPCGRWFLPPRPQRYDFWLEQGNRISATQTVLYYGGGPSKTGFLIADRIGPAGFVRVNARPRAEETFRIISLQSPGSGFELSLKPAEIDSNVRVPAGPTLCGIFDASGNAVALSPEIEVLGGKTATSTPVAPTPGTADLLVVLTRWGAERPRGVQVRLQQQTSSRAPDVFGETQSRVVAVWYGVPPGAYQTVITIGRNDPVVLPASLSADRVSTIRSMFPLAGK